jgi:hypothetical protein
VYFVQKDATNWWLITEAPWLFLEIDVTELLPVCVLHDERGRYLRSSKVAGSDEGRRAFYDVRRDRKYPINDGKYANRDTTAANTSTAKPI